MTQRTREEIEKEYQEGIQKVTGIDSVNGITLSFILTTLLDIRDLLADKTKSNEVRQEE